MRGWLSCALASAIVGVATPACDAQHTELRVHGIASSGAVAASCRASAEILCQRVAECTPDYVPFFFQTDRACIEQVRARCEQRYEGPGAAESPAVCEGASSAPCTTLANPEAAVLRGPADMLLSYCDVSAGSFVVGERCLRDGDCRSGVCNINEKAVFDPCGFCAASAGFMEGCGLGGGDAHCRAGLACVLGRCLRVVDEGAPCDATTYCRTECRGGTCVALGKLGDVCVEDGCDLTHRFACGEPEKICGEVAVAAPGEPCDPYGQARPGKRFCDFRSECSDANVCERRAAFGEPCTEVSCHSTLACVDGFCRHPPLKSACAAE